MTGLARPDPEVSCMFRRCFLVLSVGAFSGKVETGFPRKMRPLEHDPEKWIPVFGKRSCSTNEVERDDDSKRNHPALKNSNAGSAPPRSYGGWMARVQT